MFRSSLIVLAVCVTSTYGCQDGASTTDDMTADSAGSAGKETVAMLATMSSQASVNSESALAAGGSSGASAMSVAQSSTPPQGGDGTTGANPAGTGASGGAKQQQQTTGGNTMQAPSGGTSSTEPDASAEQTPSTEPQEAGAAAAWQEAFPSFTKHAIADFQSGYACAVFDVDGDGLEDVVALSSGNAGLAWFKNPTWEKFNIMADTERYIYLAPNDVDGDGHTDLAVASEFDFSDSTTGGTVYWAKAPDDPTTTQTWALHLIDTVPASHRLRWGDIDGDGVKELLNLPIFGTGSTAPEYVGAVELKAYSVPDDPQGAWDIQVLDDSLLEVAHGINVVDWDGDAAQDILTAANAGVYLFRPQLGVAPFHLGAGMDGMRPTRGSSEVSLGSLGGDRFVATIEPWHGTDAVVYTPGASEDELWDRRVIGTDFVHGHGFATVDLNADGFDEVVGGGGQGDLVSMIYRYIPSTDEWEKIELDTGGVAVSDMKIADLNQDGAPDIVSIGGSPTNNVVWYENTP